MTRKMTRLFVVLLLAQSLAIAATTSLTGSVHDSSGKPQFGAVVEIFNAASPRGLTTFTNEKGLYSFTGIAAGTYFIKATATAFLPTMRENVSVASGAHLVVNLTVNTLFEAIRWLPQQNPQTDSDDWQWTLRSAARRPILRVLEDGSPLVVSSEDNDHPVLKARVEVASLPQAMSSSDLATSFNIEQSLFSTGTLSFSGNIGSMENEPSGTVRTSYTRELSSGHKPMLAFTAARFASPDTAMHHAALNALALSLSDSFSLLNFIQLDYGTDLQSIQFRGRALALRPHGDISAHLGKNTVLEYRFATSRPTLRNQQEFAAAPADLSEANPRVSLHNDMPKIERARHNEVSLAHRFGKQNFQAALFEDSVRDPALSGAGVVSSATGDLLPDVYSSTFTFHGPAMHTYGTRMVFERDLPGSTQASFSYSYGGALFVSQPETLLDPDSSLFRMAKAHTVAMSFSGTAPRTRTYWRASYRWDSLHNAVTPVDQFNASPGQADNYLSFFVRQPLPCPGFIPGKMEALVDVRNLLAQGYVPMMGADGRTLYLVQTARSVRGGVAFSF